MKLSAAELIAEVSYTFGWTVDHVLEMPARRFFAMLEQARRIRAVERIDACDIAAIPGCKPEYYKELRGGFIGRLTREEPEDVEPAPVLTDADAHNALIGLFH